MSYSASRPLRTLLFGAVVALMVGLLGPVSPATAAGPITGLNPVIAATPAPIVGNTLTASQVGATSPANNVTFTWQWQADAVNIVGATNSSFTLTSDQFGKQMRVVMTAHANGKDDTPATSAATTAVQGVFTAAPIVTIDDTTPVVDDEISASVTTDSTPVADSYTFEWFADGSPISGATNAAYTPTADDVTKVLVAKATPVKTNYVSSSGIGSSDPTSAVAKADFIPGPTASITGTPKVGEELTAVASGEAPAGSYTYQWNASDVAISGATSDKYTLTGAEDGALITVTVTATKAGYNDSSDTSDPTSAVAKGDFTGAPTTVSITGTPKVGVQLSANASGETPAGDGYTYQWNAGADGDVPVAGATSSTFTPTADEEAEKITVTVTATKVGYNPSGAATSDPTAAVAKGDFSGAPTASITGTPRVGLQLTANASGETPAGTGYTYQWEADGAEILNATSSTFTPTASEFNKVITVVIKATKAGYNDSASDESDPTTPVEPAVLQNFTTAATANLNNTAPKVGDTLTVTPTGESPDTSTFNYQWYRISALGVKSAMVGEFGSSYVVTPGNLNYKLQVKVTATKFGYNNRSSSSVQTNRVNMITLSKTTVARGSTLGVTARHLRAGQVYRIFIDGITVYKGTVPSTGTASRTVTVPTSIGTGDKRVWVSGYDKSGVRDFTVLTRIPVT